VQYESAWHFYYLSAAGFLVLAPLLYLYIGSFCSRRDRLQLADLRHGLPALGVFLVALVMVWGYARAETEPVSGPLPFMVTHFWDGFWAINLIQIGLYLVAMFSAVNRYQRRLHETHSEIGRIGLGWLRGLLTVAGLHWLFVSTRAFLGLTGLSNAGLLAVVDLFSITIFLVFTTALVVKGLNQLELVPRVEQRPKYVESRLGEDELAQEAARLKRILESDRLHLQSSLTLDQLATRLGVPSHRLSQVINSAFGQNFFNFINAHRVAAAQVQLCDPDCNKKTMLQILHESGFNSKSAFNEAFKRHAGVTPSVFRRQRQSFANCLLETS